MYSFKYFSNRSILPLAVFTLFGCVSPNNVNSYAISTETPIQISSTSIAVDENRFMEALANENYLADCRKLYPPVYKHPIGYRNIFPLNTSASDVLMMLGEPQHRTSISREQEEWTYGSYDDELYYFVYMKKDVVDSIRVIKDEHMTQSLQQILETYGCPELIVTVTKEPDISVETTSTPSVPTYGFVYFEYITAGLSLGFDGYPLLSSDIPVYTNIVSSEFLKDEYRSVSFPYDTPIELKEAVK